MTGITATDRRSVGIDYEDPGNGAGFDGSNGPVHTRIMRHAPEVTGEATCVVGQGVLVQAHVAGVARSWVRAAPISRLGVGPLGTTVSTRRR